MTFPLQLHWPPMVELGSTYTMTLGERLHALATRQWMFFHHGPHALLFLFFNLTNLILSLLCSTKVTRSHLGVLVQKLQNLVQENKTRVVVREQSALVLSKGVQRELMQ